MADPLNITVLAKKGGVGKSTTSVLLYEVLRHAGKSVALKDWDAQGTSSKALELIHGQRPETTANPDIVIWDTPPSLDHTATATAVRSANLALVITTPAPSDIWEAEEPVRFVRDKNPNHRARRLQQGPQSHRCLAHFHESASRSASPPCQSRSATASATSTPWPKAGKRSTPSPAKKPSNLRLRCSR